MMTKFLALIAIFTSALSFAHQIDEQFYHEILDQIEANKNMCVAKTLEDRIYLKPDRLYPTEQGLYLNLNDVDYVPLPMLNSDSNGCYVPCIEIFNKCPGCNERYFIRCTNPECPLVQRGQEREKEKERSKQEKKKDKEKRKK